MMLIRFSIRRATLALGATCFLLGVQAQSVFYTATFEGGTFPPEFDLGPEVERRDSDGEGTGEFVPAWRIGNAAEANANSYFPVPDGPVGNRFAMANDDAEPCDCDMSEVSLTLSTPSFVARNNVTLHCRVFHERTLGGGEALVEVSIAGGVWILIATVPAQEGQWQPLQVNLSAFDGLDNMRIRFRWSDNGNWASGFAVDDIVLRERFASDITTTGVFTGDPTANAFQSGDQRLSYSRIPLAQLAPLTVSTEVFNAGTQVLDAITLTTTIALNGTVEFTHDSLLNGTLLPGERRVVVLASNWSPLEAGEITLAGQASHSGVDEDPSNDMAMARLLVTGPGWDLGYGAMARDLGEEQGLLGSDEGFILGNRMELPIGGSTVRGITAYVAASSTLGAEVRAMLMDANLAFVDTSLRHVLTQEDLDRASVGEPLYLPFSGLSPLAAGDYYICIQQLPATGSVFIGLSGTSPVGASLYMVGETFVVSYPQGTPMVRMHLEDYAVGIPHNGNAGHIAMQVFPVPLSAEGTLRFELAQASRVGLRLLDLQGRIALEQELGLLGTGTHTVDLTVANLAQGVHLLELQQNGIRTIMRIVVVR